MLCIGIARPGGPEMLQLVERPLPHPAPHQVRIRVAAAGLNRGDVEQRRGHYPPPSGASDLPGLEVSGTVDALGDAVTSLALGDPVCALLPGGGYAQACVVAADHCLPVPAGVSLVDAAALPETAFTVWSTVFQQARLQPGETLLVHGGASGIGTIAIQMAVARGHRVFATAGGADKCAACRALGAGLAVDHRSDDFVEAVLAATGGRGADVVLDMVGGDYVERELRAMADGGRLVFIAFLRGHKAGIDIRRMMLRRLQLSGSTLRARPDADKAGIAHELRREVWPLLDAGRMRPVVAEVFDLADAAAAHRALEEGRHVGKLLLRMPA